MTQVAPNQGRRVRRNNGGIEYDYKLGAYETVPGAGGQMYSCQRNDGWLGLAAPPAPTGPASFDDHSNKQERFSAIQEPLDSLLARHCYSIDAKASYILTSTRPYHPPFVRMSGTPGSSSRPSQYYNEEPSKEITSFDDNNDHDLRHHLTASINQQQHQDTYTDYNQWDGPEPTLAHGSSYDEQEFTQSYQHPTHQGNLPLAYYSHGPSYPVMAHYAPATAGYGPVAPVPYSVYTQEPAPPVVAVPPAPPMAPPAPPPGKPKDKPKPHLKFVRYQEANPLFCGDDQIFPKIFGDCGKNMAEIETQPRLVCYRRNYVSVDVMFRLPVPRLPGWEQRYPNGFRDKFLHVVDSRGNRRRVGGFAVGVSALIDGMDGKDVELIQHTAKRTPECTSRVAEVELLPNLGRSATYQHNVMVGPNDNNGIDQMPLLPNQLPQGRQFLSHNSHTFERVQFHSATANNGARRAAQQFFHLVVTLHADIAPFNCNGVDGSHQPRWMPVRHLFSHGVVVRGRSPTHYRGSDALAKSVVNEEDLDPAVNDYNSPDDGSVVVVPVVPGAPVVPLGPPPRPFQLHVIPISREPVGGWGDLLEEDGLGGYGRPMASAGGAAPNVARGRPGRLAASGRGRGASAPRARGNRRAAGAAQSALAPQPSGKVQKKTLQQKAGKKASAASQQRGTVAYESAVSPAVSPPQRRGNNRQESSAAASTTSTATITATTAQVTSYPGQYFQPINNIVRDTDTAPLYTYGDFVADDGYLLEHGQMHEHALVHDGVQDHVHRNYELGYEQDEAQEEAQGQEHALGSSASSSVKHEPSSSLSPQLRRRPSAYHPASFLTPESELQQPYQQYDNDPNDIMAPVPPFRGTGDGSMQYSDTMLLPMFTDDLFCYVDDVHSAVPSAERSTDQ